MNIFAYPERLWLLPAVVLIVVILALLGRARRLRDWSALGQPGRPLPQALLGWLLAAACLVLALAQPRWGGKAPGPLPPGHDVVIAVDVSRSMACEDVVPNRLGVAVESAIALVQALGAEPGDRVAVVAFAGKAVLRCPLTQSLGAVIDTLRRLRPGDVAPGGTNLAAALDAAGEAFDEQNPSETRTVVVLSDGEDHPAAWPDALRRLRERYPNLLVHTVAIGDAEAGSPVPGAAGPLLYQGSAVVSKRNDQALEALATGSGGAFLPLGLARADLGRLYREKIEPVARARRSEPGENQRVERYAVFVIAALGLCLTASRPRGARVAVPAGWVRLVLVGTLLLPLGAGAPEPDLERVDQAGRLAYAAGRFDEALEAFQRVAAAAPRQPVAQYNVGAASFSAKRYAEALAAYQRARATADDRLRTKIDFALGNTALAQGDLAAAIAYYDACVASPARGADLDEVRRRAAANRRFVEEQLASEPQPQEAGGSPEREPKASKDGPRDTPGDRERNGSGAGQSREGDQPPSARRGPGGAGGSGPAPPAPGSPEAQLDEALDRVREALRHRLDEPPPNEAERDAKDW